MANLYYSPFGVQESDIQALSLSGFKFMERLACDCGLIERQCFNYIYQGIIATIIGQQLSDKAYQAILRKLPQSFFNNSAGLICSIKEHELSLEKNGKRIIPLSNSKVATLKCVAHKFASNVWNEYQLRKLNRSGRAELLSEVKGIGPWTINMIEMFVFKNKNVFAKNDLGIKKAVLLLNDVDESECSPKEIAALMDKYEHLALQSSRATILSFYLWALNSLDKAKQETYYGSHKLKAFNGLTLCKLQ